LNKLVGIHDLKQIPLISIEQTTIHTKVRRVLIDAGVISETSIIHLSSHDG